MADRRKTPQSKTMQKRQTEKIERRISRQSERRHARRKNRGAKLCITGIVVVLIVIMSVQIVHLNAKNAAYKEQQAQLEAQLEEEKQRTTDLENEQEYVNSDEYVEDTAKSKLGMAYDNEIIFKEE